jgi:hypothetical protein
MSETDIKEVIEFIKSSFPNFKKTAINCNEILVLLNKLMNDKIVELCENGIHHRDWVDNEEIQMLEDYIDIVSCCKV